MVQRVRQRRNMLRSLLLGALLAQGLSACATTNAPALPAADLAQPATPYSLDVGDKIRVTIYREPELSGEFVVADGGTLALPGLGEVPVKGLTRSDVTALLTQRYVGSGLLRNPSVSVEIFEYRPYFILGEVERPGRYPALEGTTLTAAVATAGGFTYRANKKRLLIRRKADSSYYSIDADAALMVHPGDTIKVEEVHF